MTLTSGDFKIVSSFMTEPKIAINTPSCLITSQYPGQGRCFEGDRSLVNWDESARIWILARFKFRVMLPTETFL